MTNADAIKEEAIFKEWSEVGLYQIRDLLDFSADKTMDRLALLVRIGKSEQYIKVIHSPNTSPRSDSIIRIFCSRRKWRKIMSVKKYANAGHRLELLKEIQKYHMEMLRIPESYLGICHV